MASKYYKDGYDCIIIGSALAGMASALRLSKYGLKNILILERQSMPGGVSNSFVRNGIELEASLHEISGISSEMHPLAVRNFLKEFNVDVEWIKCPIAYKYVEPGFECTIHSGEGGDYEIPIQDIIKAVGDDEEHSLYQKLYTCFKDINDVFNSVWGFSSGRVFDITLYPSYLSLMRSFNYSTDEVLDTYDFPPIVKRILLAYWCYLGNEPKNLPYVLYCCLIADYIGHGAYTCKKTSHELSMKMLDACRKRGIQVEFNQEVEKIHVKDNHVIGVSLKDGSMIHSNYVVCGAYPQKVYNSMIEPKKETPKKAFKLLNSRDISMSVFSVIMVLDKSSEELGLDSYMTFYAPIGLDFDKIIKSYHSQGDFKYYTSVCMNKLNENCSPKGTCVYSITALPYPDSFKDVNEYNYDEVKHKIASQLIECESERLGFQIKDHIKEIEFITPITIAHISKSYQGCIYGFLPSMDDNIVLRVMNHQEELLIKGLAFAGAHQVSGDGMGTQILNGNQGAEDIYRQFKEDMPKPLRDIIVAKKKPKKKN